MAQIEAMKPEEMAKVIISSLIEADVTASDITQFVNNVKPYGFASLAVDLPFIDITVDLLKDVSTRVT
ncbi:hypothetical protein KAX17_09770, partial [Candidatus Bipolaricaulota bacterium]|nr:hypothetical protein [Candidatus Bipolaricaulota bacterium]